MKLPERYLVHDLVIETVRPVPSSAGPAYDAPRPVRALVVAKFAMVTDQRPNSDTRGQLIQASHRAVIDYEFGLLPPESLATTDPGGTWERKLTVVAVAPNKHPVAPSTIQMWMV